jgi:hypothetical protein
MRTITRNDIDSARSACVWDLGNQVLYELCSKHSGHCEADEIVAKIWLIGRSYAASIKRRRNATRAGDRFYEETVVPAMQESGIDSWLASVPRHGRPGSPESVEVHKMLMDLFRSVTGLEKRSLASKYLHFHIPDAFYIYDSRARQAITKVVPRLNRIPDIRTSTCDPEYKDFVRRCVWLWQHVRETHGIALSPRELDKLLLAITEKNAGARTS